MAPAPGADGGEPPVLLATATPFRLECRALELLAASMNDIATTAMAHDAE